MKPTLNDLMDGVEVLDGRAVLKLERDESPTAPPWEMEDPSFGWVLVANVRTWNEWVKDESMLSHSDVLRMRRPRSFSEWKPIYEALNRLNDEHEIWPGLVGKNIKAWEMAAIEEKEESGYDSVNDAREAIFEEFVDDAFEGARIDTMEMLAALAGLVTVREFRNGYSQGEDVEVICIQKPGGAFGKDWARAFARRCCDYVVGDVYGLVVMDENGTGMRGAWGLYASELEKGGEWLEELVQVLLEGAKEEMGDA